MDNNLPITYRVWAWHKTGEPEDLRLEERSLPQPGSGEVLIANRAIGLNPVDWKMIEWGHPAWVPGHVPGVDGTGSIVAAGDGVRLPVGLRVAYHQTLARDGSFAEFTIVDARSVIPVPESVDSAAAAALPCPALTAWQALEKVPHRDCDRDVLVVGAGGSVGLFLAQLAIGRGLRVWVTAAPRHRPALQALGASGVFDYHADNWREQLQHTLGPRRLYAIFDTVSGEHAASLAPMIGYNGHLICIQDRVDENPLAPFSTAVSFHEVALNGIHAYASEKDWRDWHYASASLFDMCARGDLFLPTLQFFDFPVLPTALSRLKYKAVIGKSVVLL